jgi:hypothetical protein
LVFLDSTMSSSLEIMSWNEICEQQQFTKYNNLQNEYKDTKNMNKQMMDAIQNLSGENKTRRRVRMEDLSDSD